MDVVLAEGDAAPTAPSRQIVPQDFTGEAIDRLMTLEAKNLGMPHNALGPMYEAARLLAGGRPISTVCAERLASAVGRGDPVLILTGAGYAPILPKGESDGPPGAASLARALHKGLGAVPVFVVEECHAEPVVASSNAAGLIIQDFRHARERGIGAALMTVPIDQADLPAWIKDAFDRVQPKAVISIERLGCAADGVIYGATALPFSGPDRVVEYDAVEMSPIVEEARTRGILTIGIGDHGNELGFGSIRDAVAAAMPKGRQICAVAETDLVVPAMMSNWGCYGIEAALGFLRGDSTIIHSPAQEERIVRACLDAGGVEAMFSTTDFSVDGLDGETSMACIQILGNIVRKSLEASTTGKAH